MEIYANASSTATREACGGLETACTDISRCTLLRYLQLNDSNMHLTRRSTVGLRGFTLNLVLLRYIGGGATAARAGRLLRRREHRLSKRLSAEKSSAWSPIDRHAVPQYEQHLLERICRPDVLRSSSVNQAWLRLTLWGVVAIVLVVVDGSENLSRKH